MKSKQTWKGYAVIVLLAMAMGTSYQLFVYPNAFAPAGINGIATMVQYLFNVSVGYLSLAINIPLIAVSWKWLDRDFAMKNLVYVLVFSGMNLLLDYIDVSALAYYTENGNSAILGPAAAGVVSGVAYGFAIKQNGSTGGTDIIAAWVRKLHPEVSLVWTVFGLNACVALVSFFVYGYQFEPVIMCLVYCYLSSGISDKILKGGKKALKFEVVTNQGTELATRLLQELHHGVTVLPARGMYSDQPKDLLVCIVNRHQIVRFQEILAQFPGSFACVSEVNETMGNFVRVTR